MEVALKLVQWMSHQKFTVGSSKLGIHGIRLGSYARCLKVERMVEGRGCGSNRAAEVRERGGRGCDEDVEERGGMGVIILLDKHVQLQKNSLLYKQI